MHNNWIYVSFQAIVEVVQGISTEVVSSIEVVVVVVAKVAEVMGVSVKKISSRLAKEPYWLFYTV